MYTILIADDEEIERKMLKMQLESNISGLKVVADVKNGVELLQEASRLNPDILIVDIGMPGINGIDAIKTLRDKGCGSKIIIYSAHSQFEYAQDAIQAHADDYILKPAKKERFCEAVKKCMKDIEDMGEIAEQKRQMQTLLDRMSLTIRSEFMNSLILGDGDTKRIKMYEQALNLPCTSGFMMTFKILNSKSDLSQKGLAEHYKKRNAAAALVQETLEEICGGLSKINSDFLIVCFVPASLDKGKYSVRNLGVELAELLIKKVHGQFGISLSAGIGGVYDSLIKMGISYKESLNALRNESMRSPVKHFYDYHKDAAGPNPFEPYETEFLQNIRQDKMEECRMRLQEIFFRLPKETDEVVLRDHACDTVIAVGQRLGESFGLKPENEISLNAVCAQGEHSDTPVKIRDWMQEKFLFFHNAVYSPVLKKQKPIVQNAMDFIQDNLCEDLSLETVAENVGVSSYYLSRIFKNEIGETFINYITALRIDKAKQLFRKYNYSVRIVCQKIGYQNPTYFCKVFKKITGQTVNEFKQTHS